MGNLSPQTSLPSSPIPQGDIFSPPLSPIHVLARALTNSLKSSTRTDKCSPMSSPMTDTNTRLPSKTASSDADVPMATKELVSRLCHLVKGELGYGFNLYSDKTRQGQFVRSVDPGSPADQADLRPMDRLVEVVNGVNIEALTHSEVVSYIQDGGNQTQLLVVDAETDKLFKKLGVTPTVGHTKEVYVDEPMTDSAPTTPIMEPFSMHPPIINFTQIASPIPSGSPKSQPYDSSASHSSQNSATQSEFSSSDMSIQIAEADEQHLSDPFIDIGLHLSPTAAEAKERVRSKLTRKRAPPMDWRQRQEMFSNL
ncbi:hypothetical protein UPYG_G00051890 [Umbra pygmaea]|uniref:PDZ domain-containing protein n=1 Tax=Umbra pygmaea TaxID=75934 RepID=A0ABD0XB51_UMBPY